MTEQELFNLLEQIRLQQGLNISDFAASLGMSHETYYKCKRGEFPKLFSTCTKLFNFLEEHKL